METQLGNIAIKLRVSTSNWKHPDSLGDIKFTWKNIEKTSSSQCSFLNVISIAKATQVVFSNSFCVSNLPIM